MNACARLRTSGLTVPRCTLERVRMCVGVCVRICECALKSTRSGLMYSNKTKYKHGATKQHTAMAVQPMRVSYRRTCIGVSTVKSSAKSSRARVAPCEGCGNR